MLLALMLVAHGAWAQMLDAKPGRIIKSANGSYMDVDAEAFTNVPDDAIVYFEYFVNGEISAETNLGGHIVSYDRAEGDGQRVTLKSGFTVSKAGWNHERYTMSQVRNVMSQRTNAQGKQGINFNSWSNRIDKVRVAVYELGDPASEATWDPETNTYTWSQGYSNLMKIFTVTPGELKTKYKYLYINTANAADGENVRVVFMNGETTVATIALFGNKERVLDLTTHADTKDVDLSTVNNIRFGGLAGSGSTTLTGVKLAANPVYTINWADKSTWKGEPTTGNDAWYTLNEEPIQYRSTQTGIPAGTKVTYHATNDGFTVLNRWYDSSNASFGWGKQDYVHTFELNQDLTILPEFIKSRKFTGKVLNGGGSVIVRLNGEGDDINGKNVILWGGNVKFEAVPETGYQFEKWMDGAGNANPLELALGDAGKEYVRTAYFKKENRENPVVTASQVLIPTDATVLTYTFKMLGDGYPTMELQKYNGSEWVKIEGDNDLKAADDFHEGVLPGWTVDVTVKFSNIDKATKTNDTYRLVIGHHTGSKFNVMGGHVIPIRFGEANAINVEYDGVATEREFKVHVPNKDGKLPVLFSLHDQNGSMTSNIANYDALADGEGFFVVYPQGLERTGFLNGQRGWMANGTYNEDTKFLEEIINYLNTTYPGRIDNDRIYMTGCGNGAAMTYSTAFTSEKFAGFASISGYQSGDNFHLQHFGVPVGSPRPVPFLVIQDAADEYVSTIVDNLVYRNGCNYVPATSDFNEATTGAAGTAHGGSKLTFGATSGSYPIVWYKVNGMGTPANTIINADNDEDAGWDDASQGLIWDFLKQYTIPHTSYADRCRIEFKPDIDSGSMFIDQHGWKRDVDNNILLQYGDKNDDAVDAGGKHTTNVYHSLQLGKGWHNIKFKASLDGVVNTSTYWVTATLEKIGQLGAEGGKSSLTPDAKEIWKRECNLGETSVNIYIGDEGVGEYRLTFKWNNSANTSATGQNYAKSIKISGIMIQNNTDSDKGTVHGETTQSDFAGYFNYENRLMAQWNFDLCDGSRCNLPEIMNHPEAWDPVSCTDGVYIYANKNALHDQELKYNGQESGVTIPMTAGLKFTAAPGLVKIQVTTEGGLGGVIESVQLVLEPGVQMEIPYVYNSYRDDTGVDSSPARSESAWNSKKNTWETSKWNFLEDRFNNLKDCLHHINRDIVYVVSSPSIWTAMTNKVHDGAKVAGLTLFNSGGVEDVKGVPTKKTWDKLNFTGSQGDPCIITFTKQITIDRIGVNRNLIYSFFTENIAVSTEGKLTAPVPGFRVIGTPRGAKVADIGDTYSDYHNAIAMTYGGWTHNNNSYSDYLGNHVNDAWSDLTVLQGVKNDGSLIEGNNVKKVNPDGFDVNNVPAAIDGFPVYSRMDSPAKSENLNPNGDWYHAKSEGDFLVSREDGGEMDYKANFNPWTLPSRGAYVKFEPTLPGVLNVDVLQKEDKIYYIADEFGRLVKENVFVKSAKGKVKNPVNSSTNGKAGHFSVSETDNVKYSFDVYPGKTYYFFSNEAGMGVNGFYFEPYVYRMFNSLADAKSTTGLTGERAEVAYELGRKDVGVKTVEMTAGPDWDFDLVNSYGHTNQTAEFHGAKQTNKNTNEFEENGDWKDADDLVTYPAIPKTSIADYNNPVNPISYDNRAVNVTLKRKFKKDTWQTLVLPYSMNNLEMQTVFGKGTKVVLLRDVHPEHHEGYYECKNKNHNHTNDLHYYNYDIRTANYVLHENQDIIAGYPYVIYPTLKFSEKEEENPNEIEQISANVYLDNSSTDILGPTYQAPSIVSINGSGPNLSVYDGPNYGGVSNYEFVASYSGGEDIPVGSYVMSNSALTKVNVAGTSGAFKGFLKLGAALPGPVYAKYNNIANSNIFDVDNGDEEATSIEDDLLRSGIVGSKTDVYNVGGQKVRENTDDLRGLSKGIYIVNGKKYIVK